MPETESKRDKLQIYKETLAELSQQNEGLLTKNQALDAEIQSLQSQNQSLETRCQELLMKNEALAKQTGSKTPAKTGDTPALPGPPPRKGRRTLLMTALLAVAAMAAAAFFYIRMERISDLYDGERVQRRMTEEVLETVQAEQAETEEALNQLYSGIRSAYEDHYGYASSDFYAEESVLILEVGESKTIRVANPKYYLYVTSSDTEALSVSKSSSSSRNPTVKVTAQQPGVYTVRCSSFIRSLPRPVYFRESFQILVVVLDEGELPEALPTEIENIDSPGDSTS